MATELYRFILYREYLKTALAPRGKRKELSKFIACQTTFLSNVLAGQANLSLEHSMRACAFLNLNEQESHYFMLLVHYAKAGTPELESYYLKQIRSLQERENTISNRISEHKTLPVEEQAILYNSWLYVAIHILCAVSELQSRAALRDHLRLPAREVDPIIEFLVQHGVLDESRGRLKQGSARIHLPKGSPFLPKHHTNWRIKAIQSLDHERTQDLHYSMVMSLSKADVEKMRRIILEAIQRTEQVLRETGDEVVYSFCIDWFRV